jgi:DNA sulfur modification protein DndC
MEIGYSIFKHKTVQQIHEEIQTLYKQDKRPWIIGFSGGKDSTATAQLVYSAIQELPITERKKPVYIICADTLVDPPKIIDSLNETLQNIANAAKKDNIPIYVHKVFPQVEDSFFVNLIGKGYSAPTRMFRWCTDRLKIQPANRFILNKVSEYGEVIMVLGVRSRESATRAQVISLHKIEGKNLSKHTSLPNAYVFTPVVDFTTEDIWTFLLDNPSPWGSDNHQLLSLYRQANDGECPLVIDKTTPSCGNSRFGCWVCTVIRNDKSMENMIDNGEEWMIPLLEFRDKIYETTIPENKHKYRRLKRRNGQYSFKRDSNEEFVHGPYTFEFRKELLHDLLETQQKIRYTKDDETFSLISIDELILIRKIWYTEDNDFEDSVSMIYSEVTCKQFPIPTSDNILFDDYSSKLLDTIASENDISYDMLMQLLQIEKEHDTLKRRSGIYEKLTKVMRLNWQDEESATAKIREDVQEKIRKKSEVFDLDSE